MGEPVDCQVAPTNGRVGWIIGRATIGGEIGGGAVAVRIRQARRVEGEDHVARLREAGVRHQDVELQSAVEVDQPVHGPG